MTHAPRHRPSPPPPACGAGQGAPQPLFAARLRARLALAWLLLALVVAPTLGRLHQVAHGGALDQAHAGQALASAAQDHPLADPHGDATTPGLLALLLGPHAPADCLLLDQLALGDALHGAPPALPAPVPALAPAAPLHDRLAAAAQAPFQARGPPRA